MRRRPIRKALPVARERLGAHIVHESDGRLRLRAPALRGDWEACVRLKTDLAVAPVQADVRATTGSIILSYETARAAVLSAIEPLIKIEKTTPSRPPVRPMAHAVEVARQADRELLRASDGRVSLADAAFVLLCVGAAIQIGRGRLATRATGLFWSAFALATRSPLRNGAAD
jgi:hypothetical protein